MREIPFIDARQSGLEEVARQYKSETIALINQSRDAFGKTSRYASHIALPLGDFLARRWLAKSGNLYAAEIKALSKAVGISGITALNLSYEAGCTGGAFASGHDGVRLLRALDWPFPALGEHIIAVHQQGRAGDFYNITWPGVSGVFQGMAAGRFACALNQAPMRRHKTGIYLDWLKNRLAFYKNNALPPAHLLRRVFEEAKDYDAAREMLATTPLALPVIYILTGTNPGEGCIIERTENDHAIRDIENSPGVCAANHFHSHLNGAPYGWMPRAIDSQGRYNALHNTKADAAAGDYFEWFAPPVANHLSRLAMTADAATGKLSVMGVEGQIQVTRVLVLG